MYYILFVANSVFIAVTHFYLRCFGYCKMLIRFDFKTTKAGNQLQTKVKTNILFNMFLSCTVTVKEPSQYTNVHKVARSNYFSCFFFYTLEQAKG